MRNQEAKMKINGIEYNGTLLLHTEARQKNMDEGWARRDRTTAVERCRHAEYQNHVGSYEFKGFCKGVGHIDVWLKLEKPTYTEDEVIGACFDSELSLDGSIIRLMEKLKENENDE